MMNFVVKITICLILIYTTFNFVSATNNNISFTQFGDYITDDVYLEITNFKELSVNNSTVVADEYHITSGLLQFNPATIQASKNITIDNNDRSIIANSQRIDTKLGSQNVFGYIQDIQEVTKNKNTYYSIKNNSALYIGLVPYKLKSGSGYKFGLFNYKATENKPAMVIDPSIKNTIFDSKSRMQSIYICGDLDGTAEDTLSQTALLITNKNIANQKKLMLTVGMVIAKTAHLVSGLQQQNCGLQIISATQNTPVMIGNIINYGYISGATAISIGSVDSCFPIEALIGTTSKIVNYGEIISTNNSLALSMSSISSSKENNALETLQLTNCGTISGKLTNTNTNVKLAIVNNKNITIPAENFAINATNYTAANGSTLKIIFHTDNLKKRKPIISSEDIVLQKGAKIVLSAKDITISEPTEINMMSAEEITLPAGSLDSILYSEKFAVNNQYYIFIAEPIKSYQYNKKIIKLKLSLIAVKESFPELILMKDYLSLVKN